MASNRIPSTHLSKSRIMSGLQCEKRLWLEVYRPQLKPPLTASQERVFAVGTAVGELAREQFPGSRLVTAPFYELARSVRETASLVDRGDATHICEAAFEADSTHVKVDVLSRAGDAWHLIEVKSTSSVKEEHVTDTAIQLHVVEAAGLPVARCSLMHLNRDCRYPDLSDLFVIEDITDRAHAQQAVVPTLISRMRDVVQLIQEPDVPIGTHCTKPYECPFTAYCWNGVPAQSVFTIPRLSSEKKDRIAAGGILLAVDVPDEELNDAQADYVRMLRSGEPVIDSDAIRSDLRTLQFPLYFLDFETCSDAVPRLTGLGPWQNYPFQYSLHILAPGGELSHHEYLHEDSTDPRPALSAALCRDIGPAGTIVAYNASFEQGVIDRLASAAPHLGDQLRAMIPRFFDLLVVFRRHYAHPGFLGSNSIKNVLPVLVPDLTYSGMAVSNGDDAQAVWATVIAGPGAGEPGSKPATADGPQATFGFERETILAQLRDYCRLDTLAMVRIYEVLKAL